MSKTVLYVGVGKGPCPRLGVDVEIHQRLGCTSLKSFDLESWPPQLVCTVARSEFESRRQLIALVEPNDVSQLHSGPEALGILTKQREASFEYAVRVCRCMWRDNHVVQSPKRTLARKRLVLEDVECRTGNLVAQEGIDQRPLVDDGSPRNVD